MHNVVGRPVRGAEFWDRRAERARIWARLEHDHLLLLAPRRVGKTSILFRLALEARDRAHLPVYESGASHRSEMALFSALYVASAKVDERVKASLTKGLLKRWVKQVGSVGLLTGELVLRDPTAPDPTDLAREWINALRASGKSWLILLDELPVFATTLLGQPEGLARARHLLHLLRDLRQGPAEGSDPVRWILAGSIGPDALAQRLELTEAVNDLRPERLGPLTPEAADELLVELAQGCGLQLPAPVRAQALERIGWLIPHHVQVFVHQLCEADAPLDVPIDEAGVEEVFEALAGPSSRLFFDTWYQRLTPELGAPRDAWARALLSAAAKDPSGAARGVLAAVLGRELRGPERDGELTWLLSVLENDGYLVLQDGRWRWRSPLLRAYWLRRTA
ncbi:MAG: hypothetical protein ABIO70_22005 [Pseudomonadota bacterium]